MHWARPHVDPMVALRNIACSDRWEEAWPQITRELRRQAAQRRAELRQKRKTRCDELPRRTETLAVTEKTDIALTMTEIPATSMSLPTPIPSSPPAPKTPWRPAANHPWRLYPIGKARYPSAKPNESAKLSRTRWQSGFWVRCRTVIQLRAWQCPSSLHAGLARQHLERALARRAAVGGTAPQAVEEQIKLARATLGNQAPDGNRTPDPLE